jgi:hypothetical protein
MHATIVHLARGSLLTVCCAKGITLLPLPTPPLSFSNARKTYYTFMHFCMHGATLYLVYSSLLQGTVLEPSF